MWWCRYRGYRIVRRYICCCSFYGLSLVDFIVKWFGILKILYIASLVQTLIFRAIVSELYWIRYVLYHICSLFVMFQKAYNNKNITGIWISILIFCMNHRSCQYIEIFCFLINWSLTTTEYPNEEYYVIIFFFAFLRVMLIFQWYRLYLFCTSTYYGLYFLYKTTLYSITDVIVACF